MKVKYLIPFYGAVKYNQEKTKEFSLREPTNRENKEYLTKIILLSVGSGVIGGGLVAILMNNLLK